MWPSMRGWSGGVSAGEAGFSAEPLQAEIIERLTGERFDLFMKRRVFEPLGMRDTEWGGAFSTFFWIDPENDLLFVGI